MVNPLEQGKCIRFEIIRVVIGDNVSVKNVDFYKTEHDFINDDPFNMPLSQEEKTYPNMTNGNRRTFFQPEPAALPHSGIHAVKIPNCRTIPQAQSRNT